MLIYKFGKKIIAERLLPTLELNTKQFILLPRIYSMHVHMCAGNHGRSQEGCGKTFSSILTVEWS